MEESTDSANAPLGAVAEDFMQLLMSSTDGFDRGSLQEERSEKDQQLLSSLMVDALTEPKTLLQELEQVLPRIILTDSELAVLLHALYLWSNIETDLRVGLENNLQFFRVICLLTNVGLQVKGIETSKLLLLLAKSMESTQESEVANISLIVAKNLVQGMPRARTSQGILELFNACVAVIEAAKNSISVRLAVQLLGVLPLQRYLENVSDTLARTLCRVLTMSFESAESTDLQVREAVGLCKELLAKSYRHFFFGSICHIAKTPPKVLAGAALVRGAVYLIGMALWSHNRVEEIARETSLTAALSILRFPASRGDTQVITEIALSIRRLIKKYGGDLDVEWDALLDLFEDVIVYEAACPPLRDAALELGALYLNTSSESLEDMSVPALETRQQLVESTLTHERMGNVLDKCKDFLPEQIASKLMLARASSAEPWRGLATYVDVLQNVMMLYYHKETRESIRMQALDTIRDALLTYQGLYDDALVGDVLLPYIGQEMVDGSNRSSAAEELKLLFEVARDLPISDSKFSAVLEHFDEQARKGGEAAAEATKLVVDLLYARMTRTPIPRAVSVFKSLMGVHMHSKNSQSRQMAISSLATISATSQYRIIGAGVHSYFLVSHLSGTRKGRESATIVLFPIQFAVTNCVQRLQEEEEEEISYQVFNSLESLLLNVFVVRDCKLEWLAKKLLSDLKEKRDYTKVPRLRHSLLSILHTLAGFGVERAAVTEAFVTELEVSIRDVAATREYLNFIFAQVCSRPQVDVLENMLNAIRACLQSETALDEQALVCILECLKTVPSVAFSSEEVGMKGLSIVKDAIGMTQTISDSNQPRWRRLSLSNFILWSRKAPRKFLNTTAMELIPLAQSGDILAAACVEYISCFAYEDDRTNMGLARPRKPSKPGVDRENDKELVVTFAVGSPPFRHLVSICTAPDSPAEVVQRRPTGTSRFWIQSSNVPPALRSEIGSSVDAAKATPSPIVKNDLPVVMDVGGHEPTDTTRYPEAASAGENKTLLELAEMTSVSETTGAMGKSRPSRLKKRQALRDAYQQIGALTSAVDSAWDTLQFSSLSLTPGDPTHLLCQLGLGGRGAIPLSRNDELIPHALSTLDRLPAEDTHRIGLIYVGEDDGDEASILDNIAGSDAYLSFLRRLGSFIRLGKTAKNVFTGGLDSSGRDIDGEYCLHWVDSCTQVVFHVTTMMPNSERSGGGVLKKRHVGNDHVNVIWSEKGPDFDAKVVDSQFNSIHIIVSPGGQHQYRVRVQVNKEGIKPFGPLRPNRVEVVAESALGPLVRATAINADVVCTNVSANWEQRALQISRVGSRAQQDQENPQVMV